MADNLLILLAFSQIIVVFIYMTPLLCRMSVYFGIKKNPQWLAAHPEIHSYRIYNGVMQSFSYLLAIASLIAIVKYVWITPSPDLYISLLLIPTEIWVGAVITYGAFLHLGFIRKIPAPSVVRASMENRNIDAYVPMWAVYLVAVGLSSILAIYGWALINETIETELAIRRLGGLAGSLIIVTGCILLVLRRKYSELDQILGSNGRKYEVRGGVILLYGLIFIGIYRILGDFFAIHLFEDTNFYIFWAVSVQLFFIVYSLHPKVKLMLKDYSEKYG